MREDANALFYEQMNLLGHPVLFNDMRIRPETIPEGLLLYEVQHTGGGLPCEVSRRICANFYGSILTSSPIQLGPDGYRAIRMRDFEYTGPAHATMEAYLAEYPPTGKEVMDLFVLAPESWPLLFSRSETEYRANRCVGHLRGCFDDGESFYTSWQPHQNGALDTPGFKKDLNRMVHWLRQQEGPLRSLPEMEAFCRLRPEARVTTEPGKVYGYAIETARYRYLLRCTPTRGVYHCYVYCYQKQTDAE